MSKISIVTRIRMAAAAAPAVLFVAVALVGVGIYLLGEAIEQLRDRTLMAQRAAQGMEVSLYQMEWGLTRPGADQILLGQRRQFAHWVDLAQDRAETDDQRHLVANVAQQAAPVFEQIAQASSRGRMEDELERKVNQLHAAISDLIGAEDASVIAASARSRAQARILIAVLVGAGLVMPWLGFAIIAWETACLGREFKGIRESLEKIVPRLAAAQLAADVEIKAIDDSLSKLGFGPPSEMLAE